VSQPPGYRPIRTLVARMADGDQSALRELIRRNRGRLQRFVARKLNDR